MILIKNKDANSSFLEYTGELHDKYIKKVEELLAAKEKEIMTV